jgi:hypothetical protein
MKQASMVERPIHRIDHVLSRLERLWHYYPDYSLTALVLEATIYAHHVKSDLPLTGVDKIEDISYPEGHRLHKTRNLEMGLDELEKRHQSESPPDDPVGSSVIRTIASYWRKHPQQRLGKLLWHELCIAEVRDQRAANAN